MKWAITQEDLDLGIDGLFPPSQEESVFVAKSRKRNPKRDERSFNTYVNRCELEASVNLYYGEWVYHEFSHLFRSERYYKIFKKHYEIFVGGYLHYYDEIVRSGRIDHSIYFVWSKFLEDDTDYSVRIFISPKPLKGTNGRPPTKTPPCYGNEKVNGRSALAGGPSEEEAVDPPRPPGPPPPSPDPA